MITDAALLLIMGERQVNTLKTPMIEMNCAERYMVANAERGGEIRIANKKGRFIDSDIVSGPRHREPPAKDR